MSVLVEESNGEALTLEVVGPEVFESWKQGQAARVQTWLSANDIQGKAGEKIMIPDASGALERVVVIADSNDIWSLAALPMALPEGHYRLPVDNPGDQNAVLGWLLGSYQFDRYREAERDSAKLVANSQWDAARLHADAAAVALVRDLINTPAEDMMPEHLAEVMSDLAAAYGAHFSQIVGDELIERNFPMIHTVGRASEHPPRLLELRWGAADAPLVTLIGKGVCFDTGGLDLKPSNAMRWMKKDMGGAAHVIGLAQRIMAAPLPIQLRVLVPAVDNAVSGNAFRPGDVVATRAGLNVEIDNTDAEGRLVLCDAFAYACESKEESVDLMIDFATLTGAARVAVGTELAPFWSTDDAVAEALGSSGEAVQDPVWRMPLHEGYRYMLDSRVADMVNSSTSGYAGAITAALYLKEFVPDTVPWVHFDCMAFNLRSRPGRPEGGEAQGMRAVFQYLESRYQ